MKAESREDRLRVPMSAPDLSEADRQAVLEVLESQRLSLGPKLEAFEAAVAELVGVEHAIAVSSGTTGLHLCIRAAEIDDGDLVLTTPFSFVASANVILYERAVPVFVDVDPRTGNIDPVAVQQAAGDLAAGGAARRRWLPRQGAESSGELKAILAVDVFGHPARYRDLERIARSSGLALIEDSCEAIGARYDSRPAGTFGDAGVFAFYPNKQMTTAEGGIVVTDRDDWAMAARMLRNQGRSPSDRWLDHTDLGYNYRLDELSAALGLSQLGRLEELLRKRERVADLYREQLQEVPGVEPPTVLPTVERMSWFVYVVRLDVHHDRSRVAQAMEEQGIPTRPYFQPIHLQPYFVDRFGYRQGDFPVTEELGSRSLALPFSGVMTAEQVDMVVEALSAALR